MGNGDVYNRIERFFAGDSTELTDENIDLLLDNPNQTELALKELWDNTPETPLHLCDHVVREEILKTIKKREVKSL